MEGEGGWLGSKTAWHPWSGLAIEAKKEALARRGISRQAPESAAETEAMARRSMELAGRLPP